MVNSAGNREGLSAGKIAFLDYISGQEPTDDLTSRIADKVTSAKEREAWKEEYMEFMLHDQDKIEGRIEGIDEASDYIPVVLERLRSGESKATLIASGINEKIITAAEKILKTFEN